MSGQVVPAGSEHWKKSGTELPSRERIEELPLRALEQFARRVEGARRGQTATDRRARELLRADRRARHLARLRLKCRDTAYLSPLESSARY
jgi:hypothetical protein